MNGIRASCWRKYMNARRKHHLSLLCVCAVTLLLWLTWRSYYYPSAFAVANTDSTGLGNIETHAIRASEPVHPRTIPEPTLSFTWNINKGDTLSAIFDNYEIHRSVMYQILSADESLLALDVLSPGHLLTFTVDQETRKLLSMELCIHPGKRVIYRRTENGGFDYEEITIPGQWKKEFLNAMITDSFYVSARESGLTERETGNITDLFRDQIQFARSIRSGDRFEVIRNRQFINGEFTGQSRIEGVRIFRGRRIYSAFLWDDGNYYDLDGNSVTRAFRRYPTTGYYRVSSHFSRARLHPITRRVTPHNGVDFAMSTGTPIISTGDGIVTRVRNHPFAGKYIELQHSGHFTTRYLHLSKILVKRGQTVQRGQRIALSGNTGRSTGPHLHFELHVNGRPVNPLTAKIPTASAIPDEKRVDFNRQVGEIVALMEEPSGKLALHRENSDSSGEVLPGILEAKLLLMPLYYLRQPPLKTDKISIPNLYLN